MGVLPDRAACAVLPVGERQLIMKKLVIDHDRLKEARDAFARFHFPVDGGVADSGSISLVMGDSRTGKTFGAKSYLQGFPQRQGERGMIYPALLVEMPASGGYRAILENLADTMSIAHTLRMNNSVLTNNILHGLEFHEVELLIFDEVQDVCDIKNSRPASDFKRLMRKILNLEKASIVCIGLPETYTLLSSDKQLVGRGGLQYAFLHPYSWESDEERMSFRLLCDQFDEGMPFLNKSRLGAAATAERLHWVSQGIIGLLKNFLFIAGSLAINDGSQEVDATHLARAYDRIKPPKTSFNPFRDDWSKKPDAVATAAPLATHDPFAKRKRSTHAQ